MPHTPPLFLSYPLNKVKMASFCRINPNYQNCKHWPINFFFFFCTYGNLKAPSRTPPPPPLSYGQFTSHYEGGCIASPIRTLANQKVGMKNYPDLCAGMPILIQWHSQRGGGGGSPDAFDTTNFIKFSSSYLIREFTAINQCKIFFFLQFQ